MKKAIKLIGSLIVILTLALGLITNVKAISVDGNNYVTDTGTITITGVDPGDSFSVYKILSTKYVSNAISYEFADSDKFRTFITQSAYSNITPETWYNLRSSVEAGKVNTPNVQNETTLDQVASAYAQYIKTNSATITGRPMDVSGNTATKTGLEAGSYLVLPTATTKVYAVMVGNIDFVADSNGWTKRDATIVAKVSDPSISASFSDSDATVHSSSFMLADNINIYLNYNLPYYPTNASNKTYAMSVDFSGGSYQNYDISQIIFNKGTAREVTATIDKNTGAIKDGNNETVGTYTISNGVITFQASDIDKIMGSTVYAVLTTKFQSDVPVATPQPIKARLTYVTEPYGTGTAHSDVDLTANTYGLNLYLTEAGSDPPLALVGAVYGIYDQTCTNEIASITTADAGKATYRGIAAGTYCIKEKTVVSGYTLDPTEHTIIVGNSTYADGSASGYYKLDLTNSKVGSLPITGGVGTIIYTMIGLLVIALAVLLISTSKNKKEKNIETM